MPANVEKVQDGNDVHTVRSVDKGLYDSDCLVFHSDYSVCDKEGSMSAAEKAKKTKRFEEFRIHLEGGG